MYIAKRMGLSESFLYFKEDTRWTTERSEAKLFENQDDAIKESDFTGLYDIIIEKVD